MAKLTDVPGIGKKTLQKLKDIGITTVELLAVTPPEYLASHVDGLGLETARKIVRRARELVGYGIYRADELMREAESLKRLTTGSKALDDLLGGGIEVGNITEIFGRYGVGKSQLCMQLCVNVQLPEDQGGLEGAAYYIDTEGTFSPGRVAQMAKARGLDPKKVLENIFVAPAMTVDEQEYLLRRCDALIKENNVKLIIIDSVIFHFRHEFPGLDMLARRQQALYPHLATLFKLARAFKLAAVITNQVVGVPAQFPVRGDAERPAGGHVLAHIARYRVHIKKGKSGDVRIARLIKSPHLPERETIFRITERGIEDVEEH